MMEKPTLPPKKRKRARSAVENLLLSQEPEVEEEEDRIDAEEQKEEGEAMTLAVPELDVKRFEAEEAGAYREYIVKRASGAWDITLRNIDLEGELDTLKQSILIEMKRLKVAGSYGTIEDPIYLFDLAKKRFNLLEEDYKKYSQNNTKILRDLEDVDDAADAIVDYVGSTMERKLGIKEGRMGLSVKDVILVISSGDDVEQLGFDPRLMKAIAMTFVPELLAQRQVAASSLSEDLLFFRDVFRVQDELKKLGQLHLLSSLNEAKEVTIVAREFLRLRSEIQYDFSTPYFKKQRMLLQQAWMSDQNVEEGKKTIGKLPMEIIRKILTGRPHLQFRGTFERISEYEKQGMEVMQKIRKISPMISQFRVVQLSETEVQTVIAESVSTARAILDTIQSEKVDLLPTTWSVLEAFMVASRKRVLDYYDYFKPVSTKEAFRENVNRTSLEYIRRYNLTSMFDAAPKGTGPSAWIYAILNENLDRTFRGIPPLSPPRTGKELLDVIQNHVHDFKRLKSLYILMLTRLKESMDVIGSIQFQIDKLLRRRGLIESEAPHKMFYLGNKLRRVTLPVPKKGNAGTPKQERKDARASSLALL